MKIDDTILLIGIALFLTVLHFYSTPTIVMLRRHLNESERNRLIKEQANKSLAKELIAYVGLQEKYKRHMEEHKKYLGEIEKKVNATWEGYDKVVNILQTENRILKLDAEILTLRLGNTSEQLAICEAELAKRDEHISKFEEAATKIDIAYAEKDLAYAKLYGEYRAEQANSQSWKDSATYWQNKHTEATEQLRKHLDVGTPINAMPTPDK